MLKTMCRIVLGECRNAAVSARHGSDQPMAGAKANWLVSDGRASCPT